MTVKNPAQERAEQIRRERAERGSDVLNGTQMRLSVREDKMDRNAWSYRFVNDAGDRMFQMAQKGYEVASERSTALKADSAGMGSETSAYAGLAKDGSPLKAVLMRIPREIHEDDQRAKIRATDETEASFKTGNGPGAGGEHRYNDGVTIR